MKSYLSLTQQLGTYDPSSAFSNFEKLPLNEEEKKGYIFVIKSY